MTEQQATQLLGAVADLQQQGQALGMLLARGCVLLEGVIVLLCAVVFFQVWRRNGG